VIVDFDDFHEGNHRLDLLQLLRGANPSFVCTMFAPPALGSVRFWESLPAWIELAVHGWDHGGPSCGDPREAEGWSYERAMEVLTGAPSCFVDGFKAPGWQISDGTYEALAGLGWWVADQPYNDGRRPAELRVHRLGDGDHWHGHIQNVCGNGLAETFDRLLGRVERATEFQFVSEVVAPGRPARRRRKAAVA
jgi:hypothetical protein